MIRIVDRATLKTGSEHSRVGFATEGGGGWDVWDRYLTVDGEKAYYLGNVCQNCAILFQRLDGANTAIGVDETANELRCGIKSVADPVTTTIGAGLPPDDYVLCLIDVELDLVRPGDPEDYFVKEQAQLWGVDGFWDLPHDPRIPYYRAGGGAIDDQTNFFHLVVPMFPESWLNRDVVIGYQDAIAHGAIPTAVAISILDVKGPALTEDESPIPAEHWVLTHYVLDGHHKLAAARKTRRAARLLSFVSLTRGTSTSQQVERMVSAC